MVRLLCITGPPAAGKSTLAAFLAARHGTPVLDVRAAARRGALPEHAAALDAGKPYPDPLRLYEVVAGWVDFTGAHGQPAVILDGFPHGGADARWLTGRSFWVPRMVLLEPNYNETWKNLYASGSGKPDSYHLNRWEAWRDAVTDLTPADAVPAFSTIDEVCRWLDPRTET